MSIRSRIEDAKVLFAQGRKEGALLSLLLAIAASSRRRYPAGTMSRADPAKPMGDAEAFRLFLGEELKRHVAKDDPAPMMFPLGGKQVSFEALLYRIVRQELSGGGDAPHVIEFETDAPKVMRVTVSDARISFTDSVMDVLGRVVRKAPENAGELVRPDDPPGGFRLHKKS